MDNMEYIIVGDTEHYMGCLVYVGMHTKESAEEELQRMLTNPTENDKRLIAGHTNLRVEEVRAKDCWWNYSTD